MSDLRLLRTYVEVAEQLSFTRAAERLFLRQQTVSKMVRDLERDLGVQLLERTTREVRMTAAGVTLLREGRALLLAADETFAAARAMGTGRAGFRVSATTAIGTADRMDVVRALRQDRLAVTVAFEHLAPEDLTDTLTRRRTDLALIRTRGTITERLQWAALRPSRAVVCLPAGHPHAGRESVGASELDGERLLLPSPVGTPYAEMLVSELLAAGAAVSVVEAPVMGHEVMLADVDREQAMAVMPVGTTCPAGVVCVPLEDLALPLLVVWRAGRPPEAVDRLRETMRPG